MSSLGSWVSMINVNRILGFFNAGDQIPVDDLIWEILEGDPREEISEEEASVGETLKGGSPRAIKDDARICLILDCCRFFETIDNNESYFLGTLSGVEDPASPNMLLKM